MKLFCVLVILQITFGFVNNPFTFKNFLLEKSITMNSIYDYHKSKIINGHSLQTWSYKNVNKLKVVLSSEGRPYHAEIKQWEGPNNTPFKLRVFSENGYERSFLAIIETLNKQNTICVNNIQGIPFPFLASIITNNIDEPNFECLNNQKLIQGNSLKTFQLNSTFNRVQVLITTDGRPLNCVIEILQGPNSNKQIIEIYSEDGYYRPFFGILETPGYDNIINVINTAPIEFPLFVSIVSNK